MMDIKIVYSEEPAWVLSHAGQFLASQPVLHNLLLTILHGRATVRERGRYWVAEDGDQAVGVVLQSPLSYPATITPMEPSVVAAMVDAIAQAGVHLPGVTGDAATAASFAGQWTEHSKSAATPFMGMRLYELLEMGEPPGVQGKVRRAEPKDRRLMIEWTQAFQVEVGEPTDDTEVRVDRGLAAGQLWMWEDGEAVSMAVARDPVEGVVRLSGVYTPTSRRKRGYAEACVHALSKYFRGLGNRCILYTDLANPTSNSVYRRIGYRAVAEALRYRFE
jgi:ribosomal protein S18 acetylase RimI-like enzyme